MKKILLFIFLLPTLAFAQLELPFPIKLVNPKPVDFWYYESDGTPYDNTGEVTTQVLSAIRYIGQTFNVNGVEYWFKDGITDGDLIAKGGSSLTLVDGNGTTVNGTGDGVDLGGVLTGNVNVTDVLGDKYILINLGDQALATVPYSIISSETNVGLDYGSIHFQTGNTVQSLESTIGMLNGTIEILAPTIKLKSSSTSGYVWTASGTDGTGDWAAPSGGGANSLGTYLVQTATNAPANAQVMGSLATGIVKNTTTTGVQSIAVAGDFPTLNQNTTGSAATLTTSRTIGIATGDVTSSGSGFNGSANNTNALTIANDAVTYAKMQNVSAASKLLGRGDSGSGDPQEITLGSGLTMTGTTLSASGGGSLDIVTPEDYGAVGDGVTNDAAAIQSAVDTGNPVYFGKNTYLVSSSIIIPANSYLFGAGEESVLKTTSNISILEIDSTNSIFQNLTFKGNDTGTSQVGISAVGNVASTLRREGNQVLNCRFYDLGGAGLYTIYSGFGSSLHKGTFYVDNCIFNSNRYGVYWNTTGEYNLITGSTITNNTSGVYMNAAGNNSIVNSNINDNTTGITMVGGINDGHCVISGTKLNHNTTSLNLSYIDYGFLFQGCMIYGGVMVLNTDDFIKFDNCDISQTTITVTNNTSLRFFNNRFFITPTFTVTGTNPIFFNNHWDSGTTPSILNNTIVGKTTFAPTSTYAGVNVGSVSADPSTLNNGELFYNNTSNELKARINGATVALGSGGGGGNVATDAIWNSAGEIVYATGANAATTLAAGTNGQVLTLSGGLPSWAASASGWGLSGISTLTGITNIRSNSGNQLIFDGTYTQSIGSESAQKFNSTITGTATASHEAIGTSVKHTITAGANSQHLIGLDVNPTSFATGGFSNTVTSALRAKGQSIGASTAALLIAGSATPSTTAVRIENSSGDFLFSVRGDGAFIHETSMVMGFFDAGFTTASPSGNHYLYQTTKTPDANGYAMNFRSTATIISTSGQRGRFQLLGGTFSPSSGSGTLIHTTLKETINQTGTASGAVKMVSIEPTYTSVLGAVTGIDYNPTVTSVSGAHLAFRSTSGNWAMQGSGTNLTLGGGATASQLMFLEPSGSGTNYTSFKAVAQSADINYSLPPTVGAAGTVLTDVAGNGVLTWEDKSLQSATNTKTEKVIYNVGTIGSAATSTYSIHAESYYANGTTLLAKITVVAVKTDGSASAHSTVTARFRKNSSGTWSVDDAGTDITSDITILADVVGDFSTNPNVKVTMGAASGNYNVSWVAETIEVK